MFASMIFRKEPFFHGHDNYDQVSAQLLTVFAIESDIVKQIFPSPLSFQFPPPSCTIFFPAVRIFFRPPCMSTGAWRRGRLVIDSGGQRRTCDLRAGVVADRILNGSILPLGQVSCVQAAWSWLNSFSGRWH